MLKCADIEGAGSGAGLPVEVEHDPVAGKVGAGIDKRRSGGRVKVACCKADKVRIQLDPMLFSRVRKSPLADCLERRGSTYNGETSTPTAKPIIIIHRYKAFPLRIATYDDATTFEIKEHIILEYYI